MTWERSLLRIVPLVLVVASAALALTSETTRSAALAAGGFGIASLMSLAVLLYERDVRRSEVRLRERAMSSAADREASGKQPATGQEPEVEVERSAQHEGRPQLDHERFTFDNVSVREISMRGASMPDASFVGASLRHCDFSDARLSRSDFGTALLVDSQFERAAMRFAGMRAVEVRRCHFDGAQLDASNWDDAVVEESSFPAASLAGARFTDARLEECDLTGADAKGADFSGALIKSCQLATAQVANADFSRARIVDTKLDLLDLSESVLDRTSIEPDEIGVGSLISHLLRCALEGHPGRWILLDAHASYVQATFESDGTLRCEAVNFDSWSDLKKSRKMTEDMIKKLDELGFEEEPGLNFVSLHPVKDMEVFDEAGLQLAQALTDVYGISPVAPLEVTVSMFDDPEDSGDG
jgi:uncharacterized protein YjbI with pentapeptide repeats